MLDDTEKIFQVNVKVQPVNTPSKNSLNLISSNEQWSDFGRSIYKLLGFQHCNICVGNIYRPKQSTIIISFNIELTEKCSESTLLSLAWTCQSEMKITPVSYFRSEDLLFKLQCVDTAPYRYTGIIAKIEHNLCYAYPAAKGYQCPKVSLTTEELAIVKNKHPYYEDLVFFTDGTGTFVCTDSYIINHCEHVTAPKYMYIVVFLVLMFVNG